MKKKLLFILVFFIVLVGSYKEETKAASTPDVTMAFLAIEEAKPVITEIIPKKGEVKCIEKQIISFRVGYEANPCDSVRVYKEGKKITKGVSVTKNKVFVDIENATKEDAGEYNVVIKNKLGTAEAKFTVTVVVGKK